MRTAKFFLTLMAAIMIVTGCDWIRMQLGMATSEDIANLKKERQYDDSVRMMNDSIAMKGNTGDMSTSGGYNVKITDTAAFNEPKVDTSVKAETVKQPEPVAVQEQKPVPAPVQSNPVNRYHVIVGSFKDHTNAAKMAEYLRGKGYNPSLMDFRNGFRVVSAASFPQMGPAFTEMYKIADMNIIKDDIWVYDIRQKLHNQ
ncbi:hypothetical protein MASR2M69_04770 [Bacteroidota bacterium]